MPTVPWLPEPQPPQASACRIREALARPVLSADPLTRIYDGQPCRQPDG